MCNTPTYCDLGKAAKDVFNKGYGFGMVKIDLKTKSCSGAFLGIYFVWTSASHLSLISTCQMGFRIPTCQSRNGGQRGVSWRINTRSL
uniref:Uncharacterized protein n=1 Tax=Cercocebus atys TaxID=9531 RepID=A0A2K5L5A7_CERAT